MKNLFTAFAFSGLLLSGCNSFYTEREYISDCNFCKKVDYFERSSYKTAYFTNTSKNKYLEVTFKKEEENLFIKIKPGETIEICFNCSRQPPEVVGEREITND